MLQFYWINYRHILCCYKKIQGVELDLSGFYQNGKLIHFSYSKIEKVSGKFGASALRTYVQLTHLQKYIFNELDLLGKALEQMGLWILLVFNQITIKKIFYWSRYAAKCLGWFLKILGDDPAVQINNFFRMEIHYGILIRLILHIPIIFSCHISQELSYGSWR